MAGGRKFRVPRLQGLALWAPIALLLAVGLTTTLVDLVQLPVKEATRANAQRQRFVVDPATGEVSLGIEPAKPASGEEAPAFDVGTETEPAPHAEEHPIAEPPPPAGEEAPAQATEENPAPAPETEAPGDSPAPPLAEGTPSLRTEPLTANLTAPPHSKVSLVTAPAPEVSEQVDGLTLPKRGDKDIIPSALYAHPFKRKPEEVLLSFVVLEAGLDPQSIGLLMGLPAEVSVAYSPYAKSNARYSEHLRATGHEVWSMLPTMNERFPSDDPGPLGILTRMPPEEVIRRLREIMAAIPGSVGTVLPPDETVSQQNAALAPVLAELDKRGLLMLATNPTREISQLTGDKKQAALIRRADLVLDPVADEVQIRSKLAGLRAAAQEKGDYLVVLSARPQTLQLLGAWLRDTPLEAPLTLAPLSAMYQPKIAPEAPANAEEKPKEKEKPKQKPKDDKKKKEAAKKPEGGH